MDPTAQISNRDDIRKFITAGNATFTVVSKRTGERKTFLAEKAESKPGEAQYARPAFFVRLLVGPANENDYRYLGFMYEIPNGELRIKINKTRWGEEAFNTFAWMLSKINGHGATYFFEQAEFWHAGRCGRCGRTLTVPESIATGLGPICAGRE